MVWLLLINTENAQQNLVKFSMKLDPETHNIICYVLSRKKMTGFFSNILQAHVIPPEYHVRTGASYLVIGWTKLARGPQRRDYSN